MRSALRPRYGLQLRIVLLTLASSSCIIPSCLSRKEMRREILLISVRARSCRGLIAPHPPLPAGPARQGGGVLPRAFSPPGISSYA